MPGVHAILSASSSSRWLACPPSARINAELPETTSVYAEEGTQAHALAEKTLKGYLAGGPAEVQSDDEEMKEAVQRYVDVCIEKINAAKAASPDAVVHVEFRLDFSTYVPDGFGTGDMVIVSDKSLEICDLKWRRLKKELEATQEELRRHRAFISSLSLNMDQFRYEERERENASINAGQR